MERGVYFAPEYLSTLFAYAPGAPFLRSQL
jgi:hypothetical protein